MAPYNHIVKSISVSEKELSDRKGWAQQLNLVIPATEEVEIGRILV
jgi:hypothetical protein